MTSRRRLAALLLALAVVGCGEPDGGTGGDRTLRAPDVKEDARMGEDAEGGPEPVLATATFGGGCFWCTEAIYARIDGVASVVPGYAGGDVAAPTYEEVCSGTTGHAECVQIRYDPAKVAYLDLLRVFFATHDPTTLNRQGADVGTQYRSVIFWHDEAQRDAARKTIDALDASGAFPDPIVTELAPFEAFHPAERYHRDYFENNPDQGYCRVVIRPKVKKFEEAFANLLR